MFTITSRGNLSLPQLAERYHIRGDQSAFSNFFKAHAGCLIIYFYVSNIETEAKDRKVLVK